MSIYAPQDEAPEMTRDEELAHDADLLRQYEESEREVEEAAGARQVDIIVTDEGTVVLLTPMTPAAREWVDENVALESWQWLGDSFAIDRRFLAALFEGMMADGLVIA